MHLFRSSALSAAVVLLGHLAVGQNAFQRTLNNDTMPNLLPDGGYRIVDYKTSLRPTKKHLTPEADDLQMGVYAMALEHLMGAPVKGVAEYWLLATGQRGSISLEEIDVTAVRAVIDEAARGMLTGAFDRKDKCEGPCGLLG